MTVVGYHSRFGGLWIDRSDWQQSLTQRVSSQQVSLAEGAQLRDFVRDGFVILPQAASHQAVDAFRREIESAFRNGRPDLLYQAHGSQATKPLEGPVDRLGTRVVDSYVSLPQALDLFTSPALIRFLSLIFDDVPLLFQSLSFDQGSQQGLHQDTAYVVVDQPMELAACWIALQDVQAGSGELIYLPGSHRYPDFDFGRGHKHWSGEPADSDAHTAWARWIHEEGARRGLHQQSFLARKGDILIWHADLAHGGAPVADPSLTRQSLVGHFCPAGRRPHYFDHGRMRQTIRRYGPLAYASEHYDLALSGGHQTIPTRSWLGRLMSNLKR